MNLRDIKKDIEYVIGSFIDDCTIFIESHPGKAATKVTDLIEEAVDLYNELRDKVTKSSGAEKPKLCFDSIRKELLEKTDALYDKLSATIKEGLGE